MSLRFIDPNQSSFQRMLRADTLKVAVFGELEAEKVEIITGLTLKKKLFLSHSIAFHEPYAHYAFYTGLLYKP